MPHIEHLELWASLLVLFLRHTVRHDDLVESARVDTLKSITAEDTMCDQSIYFCCALLFQ